MGKSILEENVLKHFLAIDFCIENGMLMPALVLIYNGIDVFASLNREENKDRATKDDFVTWCNQYVLPASSLKCNGLDLYAARCGILHTYTSISDISIKNKASEVFYYIGRIDEKKYKDIIDRNYSSKVILVNLNELEIAFKKGFFTFIDELCKTPHKELLVYERAKKFFIDRPEK